MSDLIKKLSAVLASALLVAGCTNTAEQTTEITNSEEVTIAADGELTTDTDLTYEDKLFTTDTVHVIEVEIADEDWQDLLANPTDKTKYHANVTIDGETISDVSFATKGNTSLTSVAQDENSDRYSYKINFGKYTDGQTYYGLDKLNLNNIYADATYMKDYFSYQMFAAAGLDSPLTSYVWLIVNGEEVGLYLAIEEIGESFLSRTNQENGALYKPETEMLANIDGGMDGNHSPFGDFPGEDMPDFSDRPYNGSLNQPEILEDESESDDMNHGPGGIMVNGEPPQDMPEDMDEFSFEDMPEYMEFEPGRDFGSGDSGASLQYIDDEISSYSDIFENAETTVDNEDMQRVITALKNLSEENIEEAVDIENVIIYFAAHNFVMNYDSYTGNMLHNYYLYEEDGILSLYPWDYNLAFGAFMNQGMGQESDVENSSSDATTIVNYGIDSPLSGTTEDERPMWSWIVEDEEYLQLYHEIMNTFIIDYFESGIFESEIDRVYEMIFPYIEKETTGFYTAEEFKTGVETLKSFCLKRAESIRLQLDGTLSTITEEQNESVRVDASDIIISDMGSQGGRGEKGPDGDHTHGPMGEGNNGQIFRNSPGEEEEPVTNE